MSSSVQLESGKTRMLSPGPMRPLKSAPELGALIFRVPLAGDVAEGEDAFLGAGFFFVAAGAAEGCVESVCAEGVEKGLGFQQSAAALGSERTGLAPSASASSLRHTMSLRPSSAV